MLQRIFYSCVVLLIFSRTNGQVNLQTGSATFSLPMFSWQDDKSRLNSVVALSYNSGNGLKVNEIASNAGQGWGLIAGGVVTRMQVGEPDDQKAYGTTPESDISKYPNGYLYATVPAATGCPNALIRYPIYGSKNQLYKLHNSVAEDRQLDYFTFQFNGKAGMFILDAAGGDHGVPIGDTKLKINFQRDVSAANGTYDGTRTAITSFTIQDVDGLIYRFKDQAKGRVFEYTYSDYTTTQPWTATKFKSSYTYHQAAFPNDKYKNAWITGNWFLSEVEDPLTHRKITFTYNTVTTTNSAAYDIVINRTSEHDYALIMHKTAVTKGPQINTISYPDGHSVVFTYDTKDRIDLNGDKAMSAVTVSYQGRYLSRYLLKTGYVMKNRYGNPVSDYEKSIARLYLKSVQKIGVDLKEDTPPYLFNYYLGSSVTDDFVPPAFFWAKDIWGYYNGDYSKDSYEGAIPINSTLSELDDKGNYKKLCGLSFLRDNTGGSTVTLNAKPGYAKNGLLKQIIYPTGGTLSYEYDQNTGVFAGETATNITGGVHVSKTSSTDGGFSNNCANPITTAYNYVLADGKSSLWGLERPINEMGFESYTHYQREEKRLKFSWITGVTCKWNYQYPGIVSSTQAVQLSWFLQNVMPVINTVMGVLSVVTTVMDVVTLVGCTSVVLSWVAVIVDIAGGIIQQVLDCSRNVKTTNSRSFYNFDLNGSNPLPVQFKRVEITESPGTGGKTVHEFTSSDDYAVWVPANANLSTKQRFAPWAYGLPKNTTVYAANGNKIKETENLYDWGAGSNIKHEASFCSAHPDGYPSTCLSINYDYHSNLVACNCEIKETFSQKSSDWVNPAVYNATGYETGKGHELVADIFTYYSGRTELKTTKERVYNPANSSLYAETITNYYYNNGVSGTGTFPIGNYDINQIQTYQSNGDRVEKNIKYSSDFGSSTLAGTLALNNIVSLPVVTKTSVYKAGPGSGSGDLSSEETEFIKIPNGDIKPLGTLLTRYSRPGVSPSVKEVQRFTYDNNYNLTGLKDEGNRQVTNIYDYNDKYVVAAVINADPVADKPAYTSFETDDFSRSGWTLTGAAAYPLTSVITGARSLTLAAGKSLGRTGLNTSKGYTLSFWSTTALTISAGATLKKSSPVINGLTYYEYDIAAGTASVTVSGTGTLDELRLYPKTARMRTVTYDPLIGKTSECDVNNRITYYEYDNLGRLRFIKDETKNIVKMYEYNNVSAAKQNGCPATYGNQFISETFTKSCSAGYQGAAVTFTVPANTYTSTLSPWDADAKAENYILANGQANADATGGCLLIYYNDIQSKGFATEGCAPGYAGGTVTYTVPAKRYSSLVSKDEANEIALDEIDANGPSYANNHPVCVIDNNPDWDWKDGDPFYCLTVNGVLPAHTFLLMTDRNPNSPTFNNTQWVDAGPQDECPAGTYFSAERNQSFTKACPGGYTGTAVNYRVAPGKYSSVVSQAAADQLAQNEVDANGQAYANASPTASCTLAPVNVTIKNVGSNGTETFYVTFTAVSGGSNILYNNKILAAGESYTGNVVPGTYTIQIEAKSGSTMKFSVNGAIQQGNIVTYNNVSITNVLTLYAGVYQNIQQTVYYTRNNCAPTETPSSVPFNVQANIYTSLISQTDANTQAVEVTKPAGQANANTIGTCTPPPPATTSIVYTNKLTKTVTLKLTNASTGTLYTFSLAAGKTSVTIGTVPTGTYNAIMTANGPSSYYSINAYTQTVADTDLKINGVVLNTATTTVTAR